MYMCKLNIVWSLLLVCCSACGYVSASEADKPYAQLGRTPSVTEIQNWDNDVRYDGLGLPEGEGTHAEGKIIYLEQCSSCHGEKLEGVTELGRGPLIGPGLTISDHWPYAPTLFDFIRRAMPFNAPASLTDNEVYALCAFILGEGGIHPTDVPMNAKRLSRITMPNRDNFIPDPRPDAGGGSP